MLHRLLSILGFLLVALPSVAQPSMSPINVINYDLSLEVFPSKDSIEGVVHLEILPLQPGLDSIDLAAQGLAIRSVTRGPLRCRFEQDSMRVRVYFESAPGMGGTFPLTFTYGARPTKGLRIDSTRLFAVFHTPRWMVCNFDPADRATFTLRLTVPDDMTTIGPGLHFRHDRWSDNRIHDVWELREPYPSYLYGFAAGRFAEARDTAHGVVLRYLAERIPADSLHRAFRSTIPALEFFMSKAGIPLPVRTYSQAALAGSPAQEQAGFALLPLGFVEGLLADEREDWLIAHELAHQWWGNSLTCASWSHFWLNEGMAVFMTAAFKEHRWGGEEYEREIIRARLGYERAKGAGRDRTLVYDGWKTPDDAGGTIPYLKGALVLHLLRSWLGEETFWKGIRIYTERNRDRSVLTADLQKALQEAAGRDLSLFFDGWVYGVGPERIVARHEIRGDSVVIVLEQQAASASAVPIRIAVQTDSRRVSHLIELTALRDTVTLPLGGGDLLSLRLDDGGDLPIRIDHQRGIDMLLHQLAAEPDASGRADALLELVRLFPTASSEQKASIRQALDARRTDDMSRQIRQMAGQGLETIGAE